MTPRAMLLTCCPACRTTFRITDETLRSADGQVRCGRCQHVFDAYATLEEETALSLREVLEQVARGGDADDADADEEDGLHAAIAPPPAEGSGGGDSHADALNDEGVEEVLERTTEEWPVPESWTLEQPRRPPPPSRWWRYGTAAAALLLAVQAVHHFRSDLAGWPAIGPWLRQAYGWFGVSLIPRWDVEQYRIMEWVATADANVDGAGTLDITARIHNRGPRAQPYPHVHLQLKDRWERPVGSRVFTPEEYLQPGTTLPSLMAPGDTARARLEIIDPGDDAYGFELDVCVEVDGGGLTCAADHVFR